MSLSVSDFNNFAAAAAAAASNPSSFAQQVNVDWTGSRALSTPTIPRKTLCNRGGVIGSHNFQNPFQRPAPLDCRNFGHSSLLVTNSSLPLSPSKFTTFGQCPPQSASTSMTSTNFGDHLAVLSASSSSNVNDLNAFAAATANQQHSNNELKMMNDCMMGATTASKRPDNSNAFGLSNIQEMPIDVMKLFQKNALMQPVFGEMEDKMNAATKEQMQSSQLINGMKRQMSMPNSMNAALQSYHEQLAACMPPNAKRPANTNAYPMPAISHASDAGLPQISLPITNGQSLMAGGSAGAVNTHAAMMQQMGMNSTPSNFMLNNGSISSMAQSMAQHSMMPQQITPVSSYPNMGALNALAGSVNGNNSAAAMNTLQQQQQQQNFHLAAAMKHQNQLKAQQQHVQMLHQQANSAAKIHPQAVAMAQAAQVAARAQAVREAQIMQQQQQRQQKIAVSAMTQPYHTAPLASSPQQGMNAQDYLSQRQLAEYTNLLRFQQQHQQQQVNMQQHQHQQQQMAQHQFMQQHQQAALIAAAQQEQQRRKASATNNASLVPMVTPTAHSLATSSSSVVQSLGSQLANVMAAASRDSQQHLQKTSSTGLMSGNKSGQPSHTPNTSIAPITTGTATAIASIIEPLKGDSGVVINESAVNRTFLSSVSIGQSGPDDERFQAFLANIRLQYEQQLQQQAEINKSIINNNVAAVMAQVSKSDDAEKVDKSQENDVNKVQQIKQEGAVPPAQAAVDPVTI